jgi:hypothetical protein
LPAFGELAPCSAAQRRVIASMAADTCGALLSELLSLY